MESTVQSPREAPPRSEPPGWVLVVAHAPRAEHVGAAVVVSGELEVGRGAAALGAGVLDHDTLSRRHARLVATAAELRVVDLGSRNGTWVNGAPASGAGLAPGDVIELGDVLVVVTRPARAPRRIDDPEILGVSGALGAVVDELRRVAPLPATVFLVGATGTGKSLLARAVHRWSGRGELVTVPCATIAPDVAELHGTADRVGVLARAHEGTLLLDGVDDANPTVQAALATFLDDRTVRPVGGGAPRAVDVRVVATARAPAQVRPELASRLERFGVRTPSLRERIEDVGVLARAAFARRGRAPSKKLALAMLRYGWPHDVLELDSVVERAVIDADVDPVPLSPAVAARLGVALRDAPAALALAGDGSWLRPAGSDQVSLRRRENLSLILRALVAARRDRPGRPLSLDELFRAGWPEQRADARSAAGRVYVALTSLRNLGLRDVLRREEDGYFLDPGADIEIV